MVKNNANNVGKAADVFALGLLFNEVFTKQNIRGARHRLIGDVHPFLSDLDLLVNLMILQDEKERIKIHAVRDSLERIRMQIDTLVESIMLDLRPDDRKAFYSIPEHDQVLKQAGSDILSAKYIFERTPSDKLTRYNLNYHCQINYQISNELYNICAQSILYSMCKEEFEREATGGWSDTNVDLVISERKIDLITKFEYLQRQFPVAKHSIWSSVPKRAVHYFRFCKDYHCEEILTRAYKKLSTSGSENAESLARNVINAPILWIVSYIRDSLASEIIKDSTRSLEDLSFERHIRINWEDQFLNDPNRISVGNNLLESVSEEAHIEILTAFRDKWNASFAKQHDGTYTIHFNSTDRFNRFRLEALSFAAQDYYFEGDVIDLVRPTEEYDDLAQIFHEGSDGHRNP